MQGCVGAKRIHQEICKVVRVKVFGGICEVGEFQQTILDEVVQADWWCVSARRGRLLV
jgi:hypothetical protein